MALETKCLTPDTNYSIIIGTKYISMRVTLPFELILDKEEVIILEKLFHNQLELVLRSYFNGR